jgi:hypothetical protein
MPIIFIRFIQYIHCPYLPKKTLNSLPTSNVAANRGIAERSLPDFTLYFDGDGDGEALAPG